MNFDSKSYLPNLVLKLSETNKEKVREYEYYSFIRVSLFNIKISLIVFIFCFI